MLNKISWKRGGGYTLLYSRKAPISPQTNLRDIHLNFLHTLNFRSREKENPQHCTGSQRELPALHWESKRKKERRKK